MSLRRALILPITQHFERRLNLKIKDPKELLSDTPLVQPLLTDRI